MTTMPPPIHGTYDAAGIAKAQAEALIINEMRATEQVADLRAPSHIQMELERLVANVGELERRWFAVVDVIQPVFRPIEPTDAGGGDCRAVASDVALAISAQSDRIETLLVHVNQTIGRIDL